MKTCPICGLEYFTIFAFWPGELCIDCEKNRRKVETREFSASQQQTIDKIKQEAQDQEDCL